MRNASTRLPEQGTQTPSPAPDLIPAQTKKQPRTHIGIGTANGGTSSPQLLTLQVVDHLVRGRTGEHRESLSVPGAAA
jgi:hypothetical protein